ncbi:MAG: chemotaxis protein CheW [Deltaproteobacteria bacterium]|uniref:Chemotaxis protein CheW n=1 Tax=Candidatus Zymogenus saltonus TaxID=2844893 RepID=A0A9D8PNY4_9DELT|nr:chemotaxis protein CheW [Candidatus Zymogenus saltonus]
MAEAERSDLSIGRGGDSQIVTFFLADEEFGVDILLVKEIIRPAPITEVPNTLSYVEGVINLRGKVVPVVDLRKRLYLPASPQDKSTRIMIIEMQERTTGFILDSVSKVITLPKDSIQAAPDMITVGVDSEYILGVSRVEDGGDRLIILLDFSKILTETERDEIGHLE